MNFFDGIVDSGSGVAVSDIGLKVDLPIGGKDGPVIFGLRPEHLLTEDQPNFQAIEGKVEVVEPLGAEAILEISVSGTILLARIKDERLPQVGSAMRFYVDPSRIYLFNKEEGSRVRY
jgi:multiple sugar transport system ATP-binding protein